MPTAIAATPTEDSLSGRVEGLNVQDAIKARVQGSAEYILSQLSLKEKVFLLSGSSFVRTSGLAGYGLHPAKTSDGPTDIRGDTVFNGSSSIVIPNATCLASTWNIELIQAIGSVLAEEAKWKEVDVLLAPTLNLHRDPRGGRNQESYGEDAFLAGKTGAAFARGVQSAGVAVCAKHLVCNDSETERRYYDVRIDDRTLRETYLRPFEIVVEESNPASIMTSYNKVNGHSAAENERIMQIVRKEWGWNGMFMSDWFGTYDGVKSVKTGLDLEMPFPAARGPNLLRALSTGELKQEELDPLCLRVIRFLQQTKPLQEAKRQADRPSQKREKDQIRNREVAAEGIVVLRNDGILPLDPASARSVAVIGSLAADRVLTHLICPSYLVTPLDGIQSTLAAHGRQAKHIHGPYTHKVIPKLDKRFTPAVTFHKWNEGDRLAGKLPIHTDVYSEALEALLLRNIPGLNEVYEIEMVAAIRVPENGSYQMSLIATWDAEVFINGDSVFKYKPSGTVDIQKFLFHSHQLAQTFSHRFNSNKEYEIRVVVQSQPQSGPEPVAQGMMFGMILDKSRESLLAEALEAAKGADEVLLFVGTTSEWEMEGVDRTDIRLPCDQDEVIKAVIAANPRTVVVNQSGAAVDLSATTGAAAVLHAHYAGQESGNAIADVIFGQTNPSGRTSYTWPKSLEDCPTYGAFPCQADLSLSYGEGNAIGYRGFSQKNVEPAFCFGHGTSYTTFEWSDIKRKGEITTEITSHLTVEVDVTNVGPVAGKDVIQLYVERPGTPSSDRNLEGFVKTTLLQTGEKQTVEIVISARSLASWDSAAGRWAVKAGNYRLAVSKSALDSFEILSYQVPEDFFL